MSRFYERYGHVIVWILTTILGFAFLCWLTFHLAKLGAFPTGINNQVLHVQQLLVNILTVAVEFAVNYKEFIGAVATLGTFLIGLVKGIRYARRSLSRRLMEFMEHELKPIYRDSEALLSAVVVRSANVPHRSPLYLKGPLDIALKSLGDPWRPKRKSSLTEAVSEVDTYIEVTKKRLEHLGSLRSHALLLRGAVQSYDCIMRDCDRLSREESDSCAEADFAAAMGTSSTQAAALELRGLLRSRIGNFVGALEDFEALDARAAAGATPLVVARAKRLQSEVKLLQSRTGGMARLNEAQALLNWAKGILEDGRTLTQQDYLELGQNRQAYGAVKELRHSINAEGVHLARDAYQKAIEYYRKSANVNASTLIAEIEKRIATLDKPSDITGPMQTP